MLTLSDELVHDVQMLYYATPPELIKMLEEHFDELRKNDPDGELAKKILETYFTGDMKLFRQAWETNKQLQDQEIPLTTAVAGEVAKSAVILRKIASEQYALEAKMDKGAVFAMHATAGNLWQKASYMVELTNRLIDHFGAEETDKIIARFIDKEQTPPESRYETVMELLRQLD